MAKSESSRLDFDRRSTIDDRRVFYRVLDANLNRAREGIRVCEEVARFVLEDSRLTARCQRIRYGLTKAAKTLPGRELLRARDSLRDVGRPALRGKAASHDGYRELVFANAKRTEEALRVLEEFTRLQVPRVSRAFGSLRFRVYSLEQDLLSRL